MATIDLVVSEFIVLAIVCFFLIRYYKSHMVTWDVSLSVYLSWVLGFVGILLLPYDASIAIVEDRQSDILEVVWKFVYWRCIVNQLLLRLVLTFMSCHDSPFSTFFLAWVVLPIQNEYHNSGHFYFGEKVGLATLFDHIKL